MTDWDRVYKSNYANKAFSSIHWIWGTRDLMVAASKIEPHIKERWDALKASQGKSAPGRDLKGPCFMLMSFAVENLLKAAIVRDKGLCFKRKFEESQRFPDKLKEHDLVKLAKMAKLRFNIKEEDLLRRLSRNAIWKGRYPVPLDYRELTGREQFSDGKEYGVSHYTSCDIQMVKLLMEKITMDLRLRA